MTLQHWPAWGRYRLVLAASLACLLIFSLTRLSLAVRVGADGDWTWTALLACFGLGLVYDLAVAVAISLPLGVLLVLLPQRWSQSRPAAWAAAGLLCTLWFALLFGAASEWFFWTEFATRFNFIAVDYLIYTREVVGNVTESYPIRPIIAGIVLLVGLGYLAGRQALRAALVEPQTLASRWRWLAGHGALAALLLGTLSSQWRDPIQNSYVKELAGNGLYELVRAFTTNQLDYAAFYATLPKAGIEDLLRHETQLSGGVRRQPDQAQLAYTVTAPGPEIHPNVVLISMESMSADFMQAFGNRKQLTPALDRLAGESLFFTRAFASGTRTVRGLEALALSVPPIPGNAIVRRPHNEQLASLAEVFNAKGYRSKFIYGGYGYFDNMNYFFGNNGYEVVDRMAVDKTQVHHENVWGIADEDLYSKAMQLFDADTAQGKPFFAHIMTTSNHRPYTYPEGRIDIPSKSGRDGAVKYADWALGDFIQRAQQHPWFANTVFLITADHQASSAGKTDLPLARYHIPLLIYAPKLFQPARNDRLIAQIDFAPTLLGLLNFNYTSKFFGHDLNRLPPGEEHALISTYQKVGYLENDQLVILEPGKKIRTEAVDWSTLTTRPSPPNKEVVAEAVAMYQGASDAFREGRLARVH